MRETKDRQRRFSVVLFLFLALFVINGAGPLGALDWSVNGSLFLIPEDNGLEGDPMPILPTAGVVAEFPLPYNLYLGSSYDLYTTYYGYSANLERPIPVAIENRSTRVFGNLLSLYGSYHMSIPVAEPNVRLRFSAGLTLDARLCLIADGLEGSDLEDASRQTEEVASYFWSNGRWFFPMTGFGIDFVRVDKVLLGLDGRVWYPLYRVWSGDSAPAVEGWRFAFGLRFSL